MATYSAFKSDVTATASENNFQSNAAAASSIALITQTPLPLTTIYTPPASCSQIVTWDGTNFWQYGTNQTGGDCYPPNFHNVYNSFYTPGVCPDAWTSAGMLQHSSGYDAMCCPESFFLSAHSGYACASIFSRTLASVYFTSAAGNDPVPKGASFTSIDASGGAGTILADVIQVQWQDKDREVISLNSQKTATTALPGSRITDLPAKVTGDTQNAAGSNLSTAAKIGIGIAVPIIVLVLLAIGVTLFLRKRKQRAANRHEPSVEVESKDIHELSPQDQNPDDRKWDRKLDQLAAQPPQEMEAMHFNELSAESAMHELAGKQLQRSSTSKSGSPNDQSPSSPETPKKGL